MKLTRKVTYVITGPCTNFALLIKVFPEVMEKIERVMIMGSSFSYGNITPYAEFNTYCDPESHEIVCNSPLEVIVYGLEALDYNYYDKEFINKIKEHSSPYAWLFADMYQQVQIATIEIEKKVDFPPVMYDSGLIPGLIKKDYMIAKPVKLKVYKDGEMRGKTSYEF